MMPRRSTQHQKEAKMSGKKLTLAAGVTAYLEHLRKAGKSKNTIGVYKRCLDLAVEHFGAEKDLRKMLPVHVAGFFKSDAVLKKPDGSPRARLSVEQNIRVLKQLLVFCHEKGMIEALPLPKDMIPKSPQRA